MPVSQASTSSKGFKAKFVAWLQLARLSNAPTVITNVFAGAALAGFNISSPEVLVTAGWVCLLYFAGMILNDVCDLRVDRRERPDRPLVQGIVSPVAAALVVVLLSVAACVGLWHVSDGAALLPALVLVGLITLYDVWHKTNPVSAIVMGACRAMVYVVAFTVFESLNVPRLILPCVLMVIYVAGITLLARNEAQNKPMLWPVLLLFVPVLYPWISAWGPAGVGSGVADWWITLIAVGVFVVWTLIALRPILGKGPVHVGRTIGRLLAGITLLDGIVVASLCEWTFASGDDGVSLAMGVVALSPLIACVLMFTLTTVLQRRIQAS